MTSHDDERALMQQLAQATSSSVSSTPVQRQWTLNSKLDQLLGRGINGDLPRNGDTSTTQQQQGSLSSPMTDTTLLEGLAAIAAAATVAGADSSGFSLPSSSQLIMPTITTRPLLPPMEFLAFSSPAAAAPAFPIMFNAGLNSTASTCITNQADQNVIYLLLAKAQQQQQLQQQQQQQQQQRESSLTATHQSTLDQAHHSSLSFPATYSGDQLAATREQLLIQAAKVAIYKERQNLASGAVQEQQHQQQQLLSWLVQQRLVRTTVAAAAAAAAAGPDRCHDQASLTNVGLMQQMQHMLMDQQKTIEALTREVALVKSSATTGTRDDDCGGSNLKNGCPHRPTELCFHPKMLAGPATNMQHPATEAAVAVGIGLETTGAGSRSPSLTTMNDPSLWRGVQNDTLLSSSSLATALNRRLVVSNDSHITTSKEEVAAAVKKQSCSSLLLAPQSSSSSTSQPRSELRTLTTSTQKPPKRGLSAYNIFFKEERARLLGEDEETSTEEESNVKHTQNTRKEDQEDDNKSSAAVSNSSTEGSSGRKRKRAAATKGAGESDKKRSKKIGFALLAQTVAAKWKAMDEASRKKYDAKSVEDRKRYQTELLAFRAQQEVEWQQNQEKLLEATTMDEETKH